MKVVVFGLGYVGTVSAACLADAGHDVWGVDLDEAKVACVAGGHSPVVEPGLDELVGEVVARGMLHATTSAARAMAHADVSLLCVGTPSTAQGAADLTYIGRVVDDLAGALASTPPPLSNFHAVAVRSTVPPGTIERVGAALAASAHERRQSIGVAMCPEFLREGTGIADFGKPPFTIVGADDERVVDVLCRLLGFVDGPVHVLPIRVAEALKYASNAFHATKISFANEVGRLFRRLGIDSRQVMEVFCEDRQLNVSAAYLRPGFAFGGSCLPKDLRSLLQLARAEGVDLPLLSGVIATNDRSVNDVVERIVGGHGHRVALLGLSFKAGSDDVRESPYVDIAETLLGKGYELRIYDPVLNPSALVGANRAYVDAKLPHLTRLLTKDPAEALAGADFAVVPRSTPEIVQALLETPPPRIVDLDGRLGPELEALPGYEGIGW